MKRNRFGINLDEGVPLSSSEDFALLFVDCFTEATTKLSTWIREGNTPVLLAGQIGSGKSTLIAKALHDAGITPDVTLHFDQETLNLDNGDFLGVTLSEFIGLALEKDIDLSAFNLPTELLTDQPSPDWSTLREALTPRTFSMQAYALTNEVRKRIAENGAYVTEATIRIGKLVEAATGRPLFMFASGLDKFNMTSTAWLAVEEIVKTLSEFKTLFEVNAVHLFSTPGKPLSNIEGRILVSAASEEACVSILSMRLGIYAAASNHELKTIAKMSGGNPRQALRLLTHFEAARKDRSHSHFDHIAYAMKETRGDLFAFTEKPSPELIKVIKQNGKIGTNLFLLPGDKETARAGLYGNWFFLKSKDHEDSWVVALNPLVSVYFETAATPDDPEIQALREYAEAQGMSAYGLGLSRYDVSTSKEKTSDQLVWEFLSAGVEFPLQCNLSELLDIMSAALLSQDRPDRTIIAFKDKSITDAARAYLFAKANTYEYQRFEHTVIDASICTDPLLVLEEFLSKETDIYSVEFVGNWDRKQLEILDKHRDTFVDKQMIWWIPLENLKSYLPHWTQLRQLFEVFVLDDELLGSIKLEEIEADLAFFEELVETTQSSEANLVNNLKIVLEYLKSKLSPAPEVDHG